MRPPVLIAVVALAAVALPAAGCGSGTSPGVANVASTTATATTAVTGLAAFARCMRSHGVPTFPDPDSTGGIPKPQVVAAAAANRIRFNAAQAACRTLLPNGSLGPPQTPQQQAVRLADALSFARCMRGHGVASFPDPTAQGQLTVEMVEAHGIDVHSPEVLRAVQQCLPASHGALTPAKIREALQNAGHQNGQSTASASTATTP